MKTARAEKTESREWGRVKIADPMVMMVIVPAREFLMLRIDTRARVPQRARDHDVLVETDDANSSHEVKEER